MTIYQEYRELLLKAVERRLEKHKMKEPIALCFSGGVDSTVILFALLELGIDPKDILCATFTFTDEENPDSRCAKAICDHFNVPMLRTGCSRDAETLLNDVYYIVNTIKSYRTTSIQYCHPFIYLSMGLNAMGFDKALVGYRADAMYGSSKNASLIQYRDGEEAFRQHRREASDLNADTNLSEVNMIADDFHMFYVDAYHDEDLRDFVINLDKKDIWKGRIKILPYKAFIDYYSKGAFLREPCPMQIGTGLREWHETLINSKYNIAKKKRMDAVYEEVVTNLRKEDESV